MQLIYLLHSIIILQQSLSIWLVQVFFQGRCISFSFFFFLALQEDGDETPKDNSKAEDIVNKADDSGSGTEISHKRSGIDHFNNEGSNPIKSNAMSKYMFDLHQIKPIFPRLPWVL